MAPGKQERLRNPYVAGAPVIKPGLFFGRQDIFDWVRDNIEGHPLVIHGQRRVGKTSVLRQLGGRLPEEYLPVFFDLQPHIESSLEMVEYGLAREITRAAVARKLPVTCPERKLFEADPFLFENEFLRSVAAAIQDGTVLICVDEFDLVEQKQIKDQLGRPLELLMLNLLDRSGFNFIFSVGSSGRRLEKMEKKFTGLFKTALQKTVTFLERADAVRLITEPSQGILSFSDPAVEYIYRLTSGHPYYIQLICHELFSNFQKCGACTVDVAAVDGVLEEVIERGAVNLKFVWDEAESMEKWAMAGLAWLEPERRAEGELRASLEQEGMFCPNRQLRSAIHHLCERDVLDKKNQFKIILLERWLVKNWPLDMVWEVVKAAEQSVDDLLQQLAERKEFMVKNILPLFTLQTRDGVDQKLVDEMRHLWSQSNDDSDSGGEEGG